MIRGRFSANQPYPYPYLNLRLEFPSQPNVVGYVNFIIDTGSDSTVLSLAQAEDMGFDVSEVELTGELGGIGGSRATRIVEGHFSARGTTQGRCLFTYSTAERDNRRCSVSTSYPASP